MGMTFYRQTDWRQPYTAHATVDRVEQGRVVLNMDVRLRWWHPRLWWMALRMIRDRSTD